MHLKILVQNLLKNHILQINQILNTSNNRKRLMFKAHRFYLITDVIHKNLQNHNVQAAE